MRARALPLAKQTLAVCALTVRPRVGHVVIGADASNYYLPIVVSGRPAEAIPCAVNDVIALEGSLRQGNDGCFSLETTKDDVEVRIPPGSHRHSVRCATLPLPPREPPSPQLAEGDHSHTRACR